MYLKKISPCSDISDLLNFELKKNPESIKKIGTPTFANPLETNRTKLSFGNELICKKTIRMLQTNLSKSKPSYLNFSFSIFQLLLHSECKTFCKGHYTKRSRITAYAQSVALAIIYNSIC